MPRILSADDFQRLTRPLVGQRVSRAYRGGGTALLLDFGELVPVGSRKELVLSSGRVLPARTFVAGPWSVMIPWDWRVEGPRSILFGSQSPDRRMERGIAGLVGAEVSDVTLALRVPELRLAFADGRAVQAFAALDTQPQWALFHPPPGEDGHEQWICVRRGRLALETQEEAVAAREARTERRTRPT
ncbi:hypothetical protein [Deinococcus pimensis]|uniref:hypothetical protein n=1 Tax=Deinococcus pimensis TaxID=309888 RepID=UPI000481A535|nr:hypothetical protein [Deinococcus pimensis]